MVEFIDGNQAVVEPLYAVFIDGEAKSRVRADQNFVRALKKSAESLNFAAILSAGSVA
jgi:hypothetical protein